MLILNVFMGLTLYEANYKLTMSFYELSSGSHKGQSSLR